MATINIREEGEEEEVTSIVFGEDGSFLINSTSFSIEVSDNEIYKSDIDYLIKALQKAKELWT